MLTAKITYRGTGIQLQGSPNDLEVLYETIHRVCDGVQTPQWDAQFQELMNFAYEVRKGFNGVRLRIQRKPEPGILGFRYYLPYMIVVTNVLRFAAARTATSRAEQRELLHLEVIIKQAILQYNPTDEALAELVGQGLAVETRYVSLLTEKLTVTYLAGRADKFRFSGLAYELRDYFTATSKTHKTLEKEINTVLRQKKCSLTDLSYEHSWPDKIIW